MFFGGEQALRAGAPGTVFQVRRVLECGGPHVIDALAELGIGKSIARVAAGTGRGRRRCGASDLHDGLPARSGARVQVVEAHGGLGVMSRSTVFTRVQTMSFTARWTSVECSERVQESVFFSVASLLNLEVDVIFFDTTSTYWEMNPAQAGTRG